MSIRQVLIGIQNQLAASGILDYPSFVSSGAFASSSGTGSVNLTPPTYYIDGDLLIAQVSTSNQVVDTSSSFDIDGWTRVSSTPIGTGTANRLNSTRVDVFYKFASGIQSPLSVEITGIGPITARMYAFRRIDTVSPVQVTANAVQSTGSTTHNFPGVTTTSNNTLVAMFSGLGRDADQVTNYTAANTSSLDGLTIVASQTFATGNGGGHAMLYGIDPTSGNTANIVVTSISSTAAMVTAAFNPSSGYANNRVIGANGTASTVATDASATTTVVLNTNGQTTVTADLNDIGDWYGTAPVVGIGSSFYVMATNVTVSGAGTFTGNTDVWEAISVDRSWSLNDPSISGQSNWVIKFEYSPNSNGNPVVATSQVSLFSWGEPSVSPTVEPTVEPVVSPLPG